jgi:hypothetical protein
VTTPLAVLVTMAVLSLAGALPVRMIAGWRPATPFMAPIGGAVLAAVSGELTVLVDGTELGWFIPIAIGVNAAATASWLARREARRSRAGSTPSRWIWAAGGTGFLGVAGATAWSLRSLVREDIGTDARSIWLAHATWISNGHRAALTALRDPGLAASHANFPPLAGASVALGWVITGVSNDRVGQLVLAILTGCAVACVGAIVLEAAMLASARKSGRHASLTRIAVTLVGASAGAAWVLGAYGLAGAGATNGSVDLFWSAAAIGAAGLGLVLPIGGEHARAAAVLAVAAGLTKDAGIVTAVIVFVLIGARWLIASRRGLRLSVRGISRRRGLLAAVACAVGAAGVLAWPIGAAVRRATSDDDLSGPRVGSLLSRTDSTWNALTAQLHLAGLALLIGIVAVIFLGRARRSIGLGSDGWLWVLGVGEVVAVGLVYIGGSRQIGSWLSATSSQEVLFANCLGLALLAWWCVTGTVALLAPLVPAGSPAPAGSRAPAGTSEAPPTGPADPADVDAGGRAVLHPGS